jgi:hypothetical protein
MVQVLKVPLGASSEEDQLAFELAYQRSLSTAQRFEMIAGALAPDRAGVDPAWTSETCRDH